MSDINWDRVLVNIFVNFILIFVLLIAAIVIIAVCYILTLHYKLRSARKRMSVEEGMRYLKYKKLAEMRTKIRRKPDIVAHTTGSDNKNLTNGKEVGGPQPNTKTLNGSKDDVGVDSVRSETQL